MVMVMVIVTSPTSHKVREEEVANIPYPYFSRKRVRGKHSNNIPPRTRLNNKQQNNGIEINILSDSKHIKFPMEVYMLTIQN